MGISENDIFYLTVVALRDVFSKAGTRFCSSLKSLQTINQDSIFEKKKFYACNSSLLPMYNISEVLLQIT
jgi:hypothetical protein